MPCGPPLQADADHHDDVLDDARLELKDLSIDIDKSLVDDVVRGSELRAGVAASGSSSGLLTVATGTEGLDQLHQTREARHTYGQGL